MQALLLDPPQGGQAHTHPILPLFPLVAMPVRVLSPRPTSRRASTRVHPILPPFFSLFLIFFFSTTIPVQPQRESTRLARLRCLTARRPPSSRQAEARQRIIKYELRRELVYYSQENLCNALDAAARGATCVQHVSVRSRTRQRVCAALKTNSSFPEQQPSSTSASVVHARVFCLFVSFMDKKK